MSTADPPGRGSRRRRIRVAPMGVLAAFTRDAFAALAIAHDASTPAPAVSRWEMRRVRARKEDLREK